MENKPSDSSSESLLVLLSSRNCGGQLSDGLKVWTLRWAKVRDSNSSVPYPLVRQQGRKRIIYLRNLFLGRRIHLGGKGRWETPEREELLALLFNQSFARLGLRAV